MQLARRIKYKIFRFNKKTALRINPFNKKKNKNIKLVFIYLI